MTHHNSNIHAVTCTHTHTHTYSMSYYRFDSSQPDWLQFLSVSFWKAFCCFITTAAIKYSCVAQLDLTRNLDQSGAALNCSTQHHLCLCLCPHSLPRNFHIGWFCSAFAANAQRQPRKHCECEEAKSMEVKGGGRVRNVFWPKTNFHRILNHDFIITIVTMFLEPYISVLDAEPQNCTKIICIF